MNVSATASAVDVDSRGGDREDTIRLKIHTDFRYQVPIIVFHISAFTAILCFGLPINPPVSGREPARGSISKSVPTHSPGLWFTCTIAAVLMWFYRRSIIKLIWAMLLRNRSTGLKINQKIPSAMILKQQKRHNSLAQLHKHKTVNLRRAKRLCTGDGLHMSGTMSMIQSVPQIHYRVTRSGRVYGKYPNKTAVFPSSSIQEIH